MKRLHEIMPPNDLLRELWIESDCYPSWETLQYETARTAAVDIYHCAVAYAGKHLGEEEETQSREIAHRAACACTEAVKLLIATLPELANLDENLEVEARQNLTAMAERIAELSRLESDGGWITEKLKGAPK